MDTTILTMATDINPWVCTCSHPTRHEGEEPRDAMRAVRQLLNLCPDPTAAVGVAVGDAIWHAWVAKPSACPRRLEVATRNALAAVAPTYARLRVGHLRAVAA